MMKFSIIIPVFNRADYLPRLFRSLSDIPTQDVEVLFVDNGSTDSSLPLMNAFVHEMEGSYIAVRILNEPNKGANIARNTGLREARGEFVYFFDSDDLMTSYFLDDVAKVASDMDVVCAPTRMCWSDGHHKVRYHNAEGGLPAHILTGMISTQSFVARREWLLANNLKWDESLERWQDWEFGIRVMASQPRLCWINMPYHRIYQHDDSISGNSFDSDASRLLHTLRTAYEYLTTLPSSVELNKALKALSLKMLWTAARLKTATTERGELLTLAKSIQRPFCWRVFYVFAKLGVPGFWRLWV